MVYWRRAGGNATTIFNIVTSFSSLVNFLYFPFRTLRAGNDSAMDSIMEPGPSEGRELGQEEDTNNQQRNNMSLTTDSPQQLTRVDVVMYP